ncbi:MAG: CDP-alcohol phosphatidyltransferase [Chlamydiales bacterium]|nr:CDP-alcohol phosphatidyltransferase family protein [Chlamydiales bacterium]NCF70619.1 CDP-alcohol phosphatidyltransferase [Chlamydiales bacterium]
MIDSLAQAYYQKKITTPLVKLPFLKNLNPSFISLCALLSGLLIPVSYAFGKTYFALLFLVLSGFLDSLDGALAREQKKSSPRGAALDIFCDRCVEVAIVFTLLAHAPSERAFLSLIMMGTILLCITSFLVVGVFSQNDSYKSFHYSPGLMERTEAFVFFFVMLLFPSLFTPLAIIFSSLTLFTALSRLNQFIRLDSQGTPKK